MECICESCGRPYVWKRKSGSTRTTCNSCMTNRRRFDVKQKVVAYLGGKCIRCGYNKSVVALQVHHREPKSKCFSISGSHSRSWNVIRTELDKCDLLCANCHAEVEYDGAVYPV